VRPDGPRSDEAASPARKRRSEAASPARKRRSEEAEQRESIWESDEDSDEDKEEEGWIDTLVEVIIEPKNYRKRDENIINFLKEYLFVRIYNMESSFEKRKVRKKKRRNMRDLKKL
jgi:hypothetical protein